MVVVLMNQFEKLLERIVTLRCKPQRLRPAKEEFPVYQQSMTIGHCDFQALTDKVLRCVGGNRRGSIGVVKRVPGGHSNLNIVVFRPRIVEIDQLFTSASGKLHWCAVFEILRLDKKTFSCALSITGHANMVCIGERV